ncbi:MAG: hypothetical protein ACM31C_09920 [Acidobacteriota bacterium]
MIPYDDLVAALSAWRARQGLPVSTLGASAGSGPTPAPVGKAPSGPRSAPPVAPPSRAKAASIPPPLAQPELDAHHDALEVDEAAMLDESAYENEGDDFAMNFGQGDGDNATAIGNPPTRDSVTTDPVGSYPPNRNGGRGHDDW